GEFVFNYRNGRGTLYYKNGDVYDGEFSHDALHGQGKYIYNEVDSREFFEGIFKNGSMRSGRLVYRSGSEYIGTWDANGMNGYGIAIWKNRFGRYWNKYEGYFKNGEFDGRGVISIFHHDYPDMPKKAKEGIWSKGRYSRKLTKKARENGELDTPLTPPEE
ncbi:MAG: hypothetical protein J6R49_02710, partial [Clostridia bacterium]|nr:hypothetical protein [Clostridia bacterium]